jgi:hypothetical protein
VQAEKDAAPTAAAKEAKSIPPMSNVRIGLPADNVTGISWPEGGYHRVIYDDPKKAEAFTGLHSILSLKAVPTVKEMNGRKLGQPVRVVTSFGHYKRGTIIRLRTNDFDMVPDSVMPTFTDPLRDVIGHGFTPARNPVETFNYECIR